VPIETISKSGEEVVYDIQCEGDPTHNFIANGIVSHNCVLWVDEIEKAFAGMASSGQTDSGVSARVFGSFITWMQEKVAPVFIVATCNKIDALPPELLRKGRFDEIFFVDVPDEKEREEILRIHITKRNRDPKNFDLKECAAKSEGFSGAELEEVVIAGLYTGFYRKEELNDLHILSAIMRTTPLSRSRAGDLATMKKWANDFAQNASRRKDEGEKARKVDA
jgi:SpoVK/Ycf46/Vps4 family AAA+-type ATPase